MRPAGTEPQQSGSCGCAHTLTAVTHLLRQALQIIEGPTSYEQGITQWRDAVHIHQQRTERPHGGER